MGELLSISIPTRNRKNYLNDLLESINNQWKEEFDNLIKIYVFDNYSNDGTEDVINKSWNYNIEYYKQTIFLDGDSSIRYAYTNVMGEYILCCGDDELFPNGNLNIILSLLKKYSPGLLLLKDTSYNKPSELLEFYSTYKEFANFCIGYNPHLLIAHSLISANVVKKNIINYNMMNEIPNFCYSNFKGIIDGVIDSELPTICCQSPTLIVRDQRALPVDNLWPENILIEQNKYLKWIQKKLNL